jgi:hypothetical protein
MKKNKKGIPMNSISSFLTSFHCARLKNISQNLKFLMLALSIICSSFMSYNASAFGLGEHEKLSEIAVNEFFACLGDDYNKESLRERFKKIVVIGNIHEDTQYIRKSLQYSHFYQPENAPYVNAKWMGKVDRCPSNYRIQHLSEILDAQINGVTLSRDEYPWDSQCTKNEFKSENLYASVREKYSKAKFDKLNIEFQEGIDELSPEMQKAAKAEAKLTTDPVLRAHEEFTYELAHGIHHIQDMASPPHVIPVMHPGPSAIDTGYRHKLEWKDGFEGYGKRADIVNEVLSQSNKSLKNKSASCDFMKSKNQDLEEILESTAKTAIANIEKQEFTVETQVRSNAFSIWRKIPGTKKNTETTTLTKNFSSFWDGSQRDENGFGQYGEFGDVFGVNQFEINTPVPNTWVCVGSFDKKTGECNPTENFYEDFTRQQYRLAIEATKKALYWGWLKTEKLRSK